MQNFNPFRKTVPLPNFAMRPGDVPDETWLNRHAARTANSPDISKLERYQGQLLFVCNELMEGHRAYRRLYNEDTAADILPLGVGFTAERYSFWKKELGNRTFPIPLRPKAPGVPYTHIKGELYAIRPKMLEYLDKYMTNRLSFVRRRVPILQTQQRMEAWWYPNLQEYKFNVAINRMEFPCWMYEGDQDFWEDQMQQGLVAHHNGAGRTKIIARNHVSINREGSYCFSPVKTFQPRRQWIAPEYYWFTTNEYNV